MVLPQTFSPLQAHILTIPRICEKPGIKGISSRSHPVEYFLFFV